MDRFNRGEKAWAIMPEPRIAVLAQYCLVYEVIIAGDGLDAFSEVTFPDSAAKQKYVDHCVSVFGRPPIEPFIVKAEHLGKKGRVELAERVAQNFLLKASVLETTAENIRSLVKLESLKEQTGAKGKVIVMKSSSEVKKK